MRDRSRRTRRLPGGSKPGRTARCAGLRTLADEVACLHEVCDALGSVSEKAAVEVVEQVARRLGYALVPLRPSEPRRVVDMTDEIKRAGVLDPIADKDDDGGLDGPDLEYPLTADHLAALVEGGKLLYQLDEEGRRRTVAALRAFALPKKEEPQIVKWLEDILPHLTQWAVQAISPAQSIGHAPVPCPCGASDLVGGMAVGAPGGPLGAAPDAVGNASISDAAFERSVYKRRVFAFFAGLGDGQRKELLGKLDEAQKQMLEEILAEAAAAAQPVLP